MLSTFAYITKSRQIHQSSDNGVVVATHEQIDVSESTNDVARVREDGETDSDDEIPFKNGTTQSNGKEVVVNNGSSTPENPIKDLSHYQCNDCHTNFKYKIECRYHKCDTFNKTVD